MVERRPDPEDRRIWRLHLLPAAPSRCCAKSTTSAPTCATWSPTASTKTQRSKSMTEALLTMKATLTQRFTHPRRSAVTHRPKPKRGRSADVAGRHRRTPAAAARVTECPGPQHAASAVALLRPLLMLGGIARRRRRFRHLLADRRARRLDRRRLCPRREGSDVHRRVRHRRRRCRCMKASTSRRATCCCGSTRDQFQIALDSAQRPTRRHGLRPERDEARLSSACCATSR